MKKIKFVSLKILTLLLVNCTSDFLDVPPQSYPIAEKFYKTESDMETAVIGCYASLQSKGQYKINFLYVMEVRSDNSYVTNLTKGDGKEGNIDLFREFPTNTVLNSIWLDCYEGIQRCNIVLNRIDAVPYQNEASKEIRKGEVRFLRALTYFNIVRLWGDIPLITDEIKNIEDVYGHVRKPVEEVYELIFEDLTKASLALPDRQVDVGRVTKGAALTLLGKVYLTRKNWDACTSTLKQVEYLDYELLADYATVFDVANENNKESIFEVQFKGNIIGEGSLFLRLHAPQGNTSLLNNVGHSGIGDNQPTLDLESAFSSDDLRRPVTIGYTGGKSHTNKYNGIPYDTNDEDNNFMVLRYADVLLMLAEAHNEMGYDTNGEAFDYLNRVRNRAGLAPYDTADLPNQEAFRMAVYKERRLELAFENHRWFDLLRTDTAIEVMQAYQLKEDRADMSVQNHHLLYPIPQSQLDRSQGELTQNPGY